MCSFAIIDSGRFDYELLDFGEGYRLERFGQYIIERPSLASNGICKFDNKLWNRIDSSFIPDPSNRQYGKWTFEIGSWQIELGQIILELRCTPFGHVGFFAEHVSNWSELTTTIAETLNNRDVVRVLNLFAYTGGATIAAAKAAMLTSTKNITTKTTPIIAQFMKESQKRVTVTHVDSAGNVINWAKHNVGLSGVFGVRFIVEDARKFVARELRRGNSYDVVILDPPTYGHGNRGESWKFAIDLPLLLSDIIGLLSEQPALIILTAHTKEFDPDALSKMLLQAGLPRFLRIKKFQMQIKTKKGKSLPSGYGVIASIYNL
ncbi:MAG: hypothetical protein LBC74_07175 [Planctomycetaceae bacterium]|jgi:23S rRNA (cytosine1962-C5)-methyltransferase|nr:hypothetical protein [Planctomycetaceae bacterium]